MLTNLFPNYPDELALSWFIRNHVLSGNIYWRQSSQELFGKSEHNPNVLYALNLGFLCSQIPCELEITPDYIINKMTIFPFFEPFMPKERAERAREGMVEGDGHEVLFEIGPYAGGIFLQEGERIVKLCRECIKNDGETYLHRIHQIPGNFICTKHNTPLNYFPVSNDKNNLTIDLGVLEDNKLRAFQIKSDIIQHYLLLGEDIEFVVNGGLSGFSLDSVRQRYRKRLQEKGYVLTGRIKQKRLIIDFKQFYPADFLESMESTLDENVRKNWLQFMLTDSKKFVHPIRHLLFIRFLFGGMKEFLTYSGEFKPFGNGPYPCLNPIAEHYRANVIQSCELKRLHSIKNPIGVFKCDCGFAYSRQGPDKTEHDRFRCGKVLEYGHIWENRLKVLIGKSSNIAFIAKEMKCSRNTIIRYATKLGIADKLNTKQRIMSKEIEKKMTDEELDVYKEEITQYIMDNPDASRQQVKRALVKQYMLLWIRDKRGLEGVLPQPFKDGASFSIDYKDKDWKTKDEELVQKIKQIVSQILLEEKPRRITRTHIAHKMNDYGINNKRVMLKFPKTEEYLLSCCETVEAFQIRRKTIKARNDL